MAVKSHRRRSDLFYVYTPSVKVVEMDYGYRVQFQVGYMTGEPEEEMDFFPASFIVGNEEIAIKMADMLSRAIHVFMSVKEVKVDKSTFLNVEEWTIVKWDDGEEAPPRRRRSAEYDSYDERPQRRRRRSAEYDSYEDERPRSRRTSRVREDEYDERPRRSRLSRRDDDYKYEDEAPRRRSARRLARSEDSYEDDSYDDRGDYSDDGEDTIIERLSRRRRR